ncbi:MULTISPECIES: FAD-binding oxidoreductase [Bosea]|uniref:FAD-binding oxidoreductase n=1 Tax=Bosea TaxID=85413 RepID=UPI00215052F3|nr:MULTISPECIES: FAD-binding oxidoreductase [Bosea]MCR4521436.1 FAD-binding oxidoreductase [Bosea sp. 47.2.35]MDR6826862.1 FAD/FMN-containing dehydrogenase [Bosea robiniae]MDR6893572.1 FAD/FMN-containing dehydrogenase [Bosea sp. BE109]MDR7136729.1 FAD/FMN-containing dehydrogenase [Bosea sp. BE168]MDR7173428.1 FAD/FMN-containing dehydrogenase [Bosea sp. BE271]
MSAILDRMAGIVGAKNIITDADAMVPYLKEWRDLFRGKAQGIVRPGSTAEVAELVKLAAETGTVLVPQGGNTGLVGGQIPISEGREVILSLQRLDKIRAVDTDGDTMIVEAGVTLKRAQDAAEAAGRLFPLSLASEGSCTIGGNLSTNAGGTAVLAYGNARELCMGLEVVLPDGRIWNGLRQLRKDNTGYDLKNLFIGAEGTLGIITAAVLKLFPAPAARATAFLAVPNPAAALELLNAAKAGAGGTLTTFELMPRIGMDFVLRHASGTRDPLSEPSPWYVLMEVSAQQASGLDEHVETFLGEALEKGIVTDAALAGSLTQRADFWKLREMLSEVQTYEGGSIKHDVSVPIHATPEFLARAIAAVEAMVPGCRPVPFGHLGDGNIHFNVSQPVGADKAAYLARWSEMNEAVHGIVAELHGSISAEHGIGRLKRDLLPGVKDPVELDLMRTLKRMLDPKRILNPGAVLAQD